MSNWKRNSATYSSSLLVLAVTIAELTIGTFTATSQTTSVNPDEWASCALAGQSKDHYLQGPNFNIRISFREQPVSGVKVVLTDETTQPSPEVVATANTDQDGAAHFSAIRPGKYQAHIDQALLSPSPEIEVEANEVRASEVQANDIQENKGSGEEVREHVRIEWPWSPAVTHSVRGWITSWQKDSPQNRSELRPFARVMVQLLDLRSGKLLASTHTNTDGYYEFSVSREGLYVVRVSEAQDPSRTAYDKAVEVAWQASRDSMPRLEVEHLCGGGLVELPDMIDQQAQQLRWRTGPFQQSKKPRLGSAAFGTRIGGARGQTPT